jgi:hypothetical protein
MAGLWVVGPVGCARARLASQRERAHVHASAVLAADREAAKVTPANLIRQVADLNRLARSPRPACRTEWIANASPTERHDALGGSEWVLMDAQGPGAVTYLWLADPTRAGELRLYLGAETAPSIRMPAREWLDGRHDPFLAPLAGPMGDGWASWFPVPFADRCVIATTAPPGDYAVALRRYAPGTPVEPLRLPLDSATRRQLTATLEALAKGEPLESQTPTWRQDFHDMVAPNGQSVSRSILGTGKLTRLACRVAAGDTPSALSGCLVEIRFDGQAEPAARAPLGDFFGVVAGLDPWRSLAGAVEPDGTMVARWPMPFRRQVEVKFINATRRPIALQGELTGVNEPWREGTWQFRAWWRGEARLRTRPPMAWPLMGDGWRAGRLAGVFVALGNPLPAWWGDGGLTLAQGGGPDAATLALPAWLGVGEETTGAGATPWIWQSWRGAENGDAQRSDENGGGAKQGAADASGWRAMGRACLADDWVTTQGMRLDWRLDHRGDCLMNVRTVTYGYAPPNEAFAPPVAADQLTSRALALDQPTSRALRGAIECEALAWTATGGRVVVDRSTRLGWSGGAQARWLGERPGDVLTLSFPVAEAGRCAVYLCATHGPGAGRFSARLDDAPTSPTMLDLAAPAERVAMPALIGNFNLKAGTRHLVLRREGPAPARKGTTPPRAGAAPSAAADSVGVGLDYLALKRRRIVLAPSSPATGASE